VLQGGGKGSPDALLHLRWGRQHQGIAKLDDLLDVIRIDDFVRHCCLSSLRVVMEISYLGQGCRNGACSACPHGERAGRVTERGATRSRTFYVSESSKVRGLRRGEPMRVRSVQLGGSLAGKLSSKLSSILSSVVAAASGSGGRLRRACADPCRCCGMDRGITSPAASWPQIRQKHTADAPCSCS